LTDNRIDGPVAKALDQLMSVNSAGYAPVTMGAEEQSRGIPTMPTSAKTLIELTRNKIQENHKMEPAIIEGPEGPEVYSPAFSIVPQGTPNDQVIAKSLADQMEVLNRVEKNLEFTSGSGALVQLNIPDDAIAKFLDYDSPLRRQPIVIQDKVIDLANATSSQLETMLQDDTDPSLSRQAASDAYNSNVKIQRVIRNLRAIAGPEMADRDLDGSDFLNTFTEGLSFLNKTSFEQAKKLASEAMKDVGIPGLQYFDQDSRGYPAGFDFSDGDDRTRNFVIWDQDVLNRVEVEGVNDVPVNQVAVNLSSATGSILGLKDLQEQANTGDIEAQRMLQDVASDSLSYLLSGIPDARVLPTPAQGLYFGDLEPSIGLDVGFEKDSRKDVLAALAKFAQNFNQEQIHVRTGASRS
jgi:hypothetical protein